MSSLQRKQLTLNLKETSEKFSSKIKRTRPIHETAEDRRVGYTRHSNSVLHFCFPLRTLFGSGNVLGQESETNERSLSSLTWLCKQ